MNVNIIIPDPELIRVSGKAPKHLLVCPNTNSCLQLPAAIWQFHTTHRYMLHLSCSRCNSTWYVCTLCDRAYTRYMDISQVNKHCSRKNSNHPNTTPKTKLKKKVSTINTHASVADEEKETSVNTPNKKRFIENILQEEGNRNNITTDTTIDSTPGNENLCDLSVNNETLIVDNNSGNKETTGNLEFSLANSSELNCFGNDTSNKFFKHQQNQKGLQYLNGYSQYHNENFTNRVDLYESETMMYLSYLVRTLSFNQKCHLTELILRIKTIYENKFYNAEHYKTIAPTDIPTSYPVLRKYVVEGKHSIFKNLPHPTIFFEKKHAYITISDIAKDIVGHNLPFPDIPDFLPYYESDFLQNNHLTTCNRVTQLDHLYHRNTPIHVEKPLHLFLLLWSDSFEPNYSIKSNRKSVHIITCTFLQPISLRKEVSYTYPIGVSQSGSNHNFLFEKIYNEIEISKMFPIHVVSTTTQKKISFVLSVVASVHDQPERRSILGLSGGNSKYHTRFGYCLDTQYTANRLKACNKCYAELIGEMESWNINSDAESIGNFSKWSKHTCEDCVR